MANPPAPDVEAIARQAVDRIVAEWVYFHSPKERQALWDIATREIASALTAHTASLQARVEEMERERDILTTGGIIEVAVRNLNVRHYMDHWEGRADKAESEANRMREAGQNAAAALDSFMVATVDGMTLGDIMDLNDARQKLRAALRPADEPVTQREM